MNIADEILYINQPLSIANARVSTHIQCTAHSPNASFGNVTCRAALQELPHFLQLAPTSACIVKQVAEFTRIGFDIGDVLLKFWIAFQDENLMLRSKRLSHGMH